MCTCFVFFSSSVWVLWPTARTGKQRPPSKGPEHEAHWERVHQLVRDAQWSKLMGADQLKIEQAHSRCFVGFSEGRYNFNPTFKVCVNGHVGRCVIRHSWCLCVRTSKLWQLCRNAASCLPLPHSSPTTDTAYRLPFIHYATGQEEKRVPVHNTKSAVLLRQNSVAKHSRAATVRCRACAPHQRLMHALLFVPPSRAVPVREHTHTHTKSQPRTHNHKTFPTLFTPGDHEQAHHAPQAGVISAGIHKRPQARARYLLRPVVYQAAARHDARCAHLCIA